ncbi:MAG: hypothetical protein ACI4DK_12740 [Lachnospiraceae bacterium]
MEYLLEIPGRLDGLNSYTAANRTNPHKGGKVKRDNEDCVIWCIRRQMNGVHITRPVLIYYRFYEKDKRRDGDNILSCAAKFIQDSLVKTHVLQEDNRKCIPHFYHDIFVDKENPRIEVTITELSEEQANMPLKDLLRDLETG